MARTRIISQSKALFVSPTGDVATPTQLHRVDTVSFDVDLAGNRQDIREFGQLARIGTVRIGEITPTVTFGYYLGDGKNESSLGFNTDGTTQLISDILSEDIDNREKNLYLLTVEEGADAFTTYGSTSGHDTVGFGNGVLSSYSLNLAVGEIPRADLEMECGNIRFYPAASSGPNPAINRQDGTSLAGTFTLPQATTGDSSVDVLRPGDVVVSFANSSTSIGGVDLSSIKLQSASIEVPLSRTSLEALGNKLPYAKPLEFPINVTCALNGFVSDFTAGSLQAILTGCAAESNNEITISIKDRCGISDRIRYTFKGAVLDSQNFSIGLDDNETVDLTFSAQIAGATTTGVGVFCSGSFA